MRKDFDIVGSYDNQRVTTFNAERTVNMFEYIDSNGKRPKVLFSTSGLLNTGVNFSGASANAPSRGTFVYNNTVANSVEIYQVFGDKVYKITGTTTSLTAAAIGTLNTTDGYVGIDANSYQIIFVDGINGWIWDINAPNLGLQQITDTGFPNKPIDVCFIDGFFLVANGNTNNFQLSEINQGMVWSEGTATFTADHLTSILTLSTNSANFATGVPVTLTVGGALPPELHAGQTYYSIRVGIVSDGTIKLALTYNDAVANPPIPVTFSTDGTAPNTITVLGQLQLGSITSHPGTIVACRTLHRRIFLFSQYFTEVWENAGLGTNLPFRRNNSLLMEVGTPAIGSIAVGFDSMFFLSQDKDGLGAVMEVKGSESIPVSNRALDYQLAQYIADPSMGVSDARGIMIKENGLIFYRLNFTAANHTYVLNVSMSTPDQPRWHEEEVLNGNRHPAQTHAFFSGVNYYFSYNQPIMYIVDTAYSTNDGEAIRRMRIGRTFAPEGYNRLRIDRFQLDLLQGAVDNNNAAGPLNPIVFLHISRDGGHTWGTSFTANMGAIGEYSYRTVWRKLGTIPRGQGFTPKIEFFNQIPFVILGAMWDFEVMPE